jgi:hypothetical protein
MVNKGGAMTDYDRLASALGPHCTKTWNGLTELCCHCRSALATEGHWPDAARFKKLQPVCTNCHPLIHAIVSLANACRYAADAGRARRRKRLKQS